MVLLDVPGLLPKVELLFLILRLCLLPVPLVHSVDGVASGHPVHAPQEEEGALDEREQVEAHLLVAVVERALRPWQARRLSSCLLGV